MECLVVGAGSVAGQYLPELADRAGLTVAAVCDRDEDRAHSGAATVQGRAYTDIETALSAEAAPLVLNLTSHAAHAPVTRRALLAGRHVYTEKPLALDAPTARELVDLAAERGLGLGCAPTNPSNPGQRRAARLLADGRTGRVRIADATAHVGRVTEWHDRPESFLSVGPLYDGAVYPLTLLVAWFGPFERVVSADTSRPWPDRERQRPDAPTHVEAVLEHRDGPRVQLTASLYAPHRAREFYGLELHGDDGSVYVDDTGAQTDSDDRVQFGRVGRDYTPVPPTRPEHPGTYADGPVALVRSIRRGDPDRTTARRGAHVVAACEAIEGVAERDDPVSLDGAGVTPERVPAPTYRLLNTPPAEASLRLPPVGAFVRDGTAERVEEVLDSGSRLLAVEPSGARVVGEALAGPGTADRGSLHLAGVVPEGTGVERGLDRIAGALGGPVDSLLLSNPTSDRLGTASGLRDAGRVRVVGPVGTAPETATEWPLVGATAPPDGPTLSAHHRRGTRVLALLDDPTILVDDRARALAEQHGVSPVRTAVALAVRHGLVPVVGEDFASVLAGSGTVIPTEGPGIGVDDG
ncbi:Gfo/Idh/MocA family protein [Haloarcula sp. GH36]|uniref:Gfo/Idh/MocA family protein n=1 Tax=Haloarcula montana TaxID=3111776 RepID=UPI002D786EF6|nr:Gfo/Idh/MocA family oxidoreductase [Haloarcula sp. GH36]